MMISCPFLCGGLYADYNHLYSHAANFHPGIPYEEALRAVAAMRAILEPREDGAKQALFRCAVDMMLEHMRLDPPTGPTFNSLVLAVGVTYESLRVLYEGLKAPAQDGAADS